LVIAFLMVSRLPVFSGKTVGMRVPPEMVLPVFVVGGFLHCAIDQLSLGPNG
jgi:phosphatidylserine synthase